jgi:hypothetical protein
MSKEVFTYAYVVGLLNNVDLSHKLSFLNFQIILKYLYSKLNILTTYKLKSKLVKYDIALIKNILSVLDMVLEANLIENLENKVLMIELLEEYKAKLRSFLIGLKSNKGVV